MILDDPNRQNLRPSVTSTGGGSYSTELQKLLFRKPAIFNNPLEQTAFNVPIVERHDGGASTRVTKLPMAALLMAEDKARALDNPYHLPRF